MHRRPLSRFRSAALFLSAAACVGPSAIAQETAAQETAPQKTAPQETTPSDDDKSVPTQNESTSPALLCLDETKANIDACFAESARLEKAGQPIAAAALAEHACDSGAIAGCTRAGRLLLPAPSTRSVAQTLFDRACDGGDKDACLTLGDAERGGLFGAPNVNAAVRAYQRGCAIERTREDWADDYGPLCAALVDTLGEDPFAPSTTAPPEPPKTGPRTQPPAVENDEVVRPRERVRPKPPRLIDDDERSDPLLSARARFPLGAFILEGGGRLWLGGSTNPWLLPSPSGAAIPFAHGGAGTLSFAPMGRIRFDLADLVGASLEVGGDWTGFVGADSSVPNGPYANALAGGYHVDAEIGLGRAVVDLPVDENGSDRNLLSVRNRTRARLSPGSFLPAVDVGTRRNERDTPAPALRFPLYDATAGDLLGTSENLFNAEARLDFLINLELAYAWTRQRVDVVRTLTNPAGAADALTLPLFFLPETLGAHGFDEHAGRIRGGLSMPKFDFFGPAHIFGEFSLARRAYGIESFYPTTARAGVDAAADIFEIRADAGAANSGRTQVFGSASHFVGGLSVAVPIGAQWWLAGNIERRMLPISIAEWALTTNGGLVLQNRGRAAAISVFASAGALEFGLNLPTTVAPADAFFAQGGLRGELRFGPFRPSVEVDLQAYLPRSSAAAVYVGEMRFGIGF